MARGTSIALQCPSERYLLLRIRSCQSFEELFSCREKKNTTNERTNEPTRNTERLWPVLVFVVAGSEPSSSANESLDRSGATGCTRPRGASARSRRAASATSASRAPATATSATSSGSGSSTPVSPVSPPSVAAVVAFLLRLPGGRVIDRV